jgi:hypothetical protein
MRCEKILCKENEIKLLSCQDRKNAPGNPNEWIIKVQQKGLEYKENQVIKTV